MPAFFIRSEQIHHDRITLSGELAHHLKASLRVQVGEEVLLTDERRWRYRTVAECTDPALTLHVIDHREGPAEHAPPLLLAQAILKGDHMDWVIQKASELGVHSIQPLIALHGVVRPQPERIAGQLTRWRRIATEAAQQSEQWHSPRILEPVESKTFFSTTIPSRTLILLERRSGMGLLTVPLPSGIEETVTLMVGPEGGWSEGEVEQAVQRRLQPVTLGAQVLRAETAAVAAISILQCRWGRLG